MHKYSCVTTDLAKKAGLPVDRFPSSDEEIARAEHVIDEAMGALSIEEHEKIIFDIHGISRFPKVDDSMIRSYLRDLETEIGKISPKAGYTSAMAMNRAYVMDENFRMMFVRACNFDAAQAANMMVNHFDKKQKLFGDDALGRDIWQSVSVVTVGEGVRVCGFSS